MNFISFLLGLMRFEQFDDGGSERALLAMYVQ